MNDQEKVRGSHLARKAYLYIRQSTLRQVVEHEEGRRRQYQLQERARLLGWPEDQIEIIDCDLGLSGRLLTAKVSSGWWLRWDSARRGWSWD
jgi:hypothetical protein